MAEYQVDDADKDDDLERYAFERDAYLAHTNLAGGALQSAQRGLLLINGGAAIALVTVLTAASIRIEMSGWSSLRWSLGGYAVGLLVASVSYLFAYLSEEALSSAYQVNAYVMLGYEIDLVSDPAKKAKKLKANGQLFAWLCFCSCVISAGAFGTASTWAVFSTAAPPTATQPQLRSAAMQYSSRAPRAGGARP